MSSGNRRRAVWLAVVVGLAAVAVPVSAHGNHLAVDAQVTDDGVVRVEGAFFVTTGYVVLHADADGEIGAVLDHVAPERNRYHGRLSVVANGSVWSNGSATETLWVVLHYDANGNDAFDAGSDPPIGGADDPDHAVRVPVTKGEQSAYVRAEGEHAQRTNDSEVEIRDVALPAAGQVVISTAANASPDSIVGQRALSAGHHEAVTVSLDEHFYHHQPERFTLWAVVATNESGDVSPVRVGDTPVASQFVVERTGELAADHTHTTVATASPSPTPTAGGHDHEHDHSHAAETTAGPATASATHSPTPTAPPTRATSPTATPGQDGLGVVVAVLAVSIGVLWRSRRR